MANPYKSGHPINETYSSLNLPEAVATHAALVRPDIDDAPSCTQMIERQ
jgi:hypothetical protein